MIAPQDVQVIGLGQACVDYPGRVPFFPEEDGKMELPDLHRQCGGPASTALVTLSRLGIACSFPGSISDDRFGADIVQEKIILCASQLTNAPFSYSTAFLPDSRWAVTRFFSVFTRSQ